MKVSKPVRLEDLGTELALIPQSLQEAANLCLQLPRMLVFARAFCPVRTGALRDSIRVERPSSLSAKLVAGSGGETEFDMASLRADMRELLASGGAGLGRISRQIAGKYNVSRQMVYAEGLKIKGEEKP